MTSAVGPVPAAGAPDRLLVALAGVRAAEAVRELLDPDERARVDGGLALYALGVVGRLLTR